MGWGVGCQFKVLSEVKKAGKQEYHLQQRCPLKMKDISNYQKQIKIFTIKHNKFIGLTKSVKGVLPVESNKKVRNKLSQQ